MGRCLRVSKNYRVENLEALTEMFAKLDDAASESTLRQAAVSGARVIHDEAKRRVPVGDRIGTRFGRPHSPGFLRDHLLIAYDQEESVPGKLASYIVTWSSDAFYGRFVELGKRNAVPLTKRTLARAIHDIEFGSSRTPAQPFMRPAFDAKKSEAARKMAEVVEQKLMEANRG
ncbi:HK97-gp10 family putative phage morphogenesis protein [Caballeronia sp. LZ001]|uniref:HK97-gp10 family putative phage morphogenesis protein n=1 Tax=Caballeronia sp. LZ001 TaxID=3038553 RepID=UPI002857CCC6|nr:HK97-gp10 family putative phage morphogenesis protein [Caballeronia sp. LZ001]MDR5801509.1 HK97 gp10 family phage protein [Caballeronia sp. LZ001]MDR5802327.1 HK97 gp10 family phage protein [Caballeronia sp. LZ001]